MREQVKLAATVLFALGMATTAARADACSGHSHTGATVAGAAGGGLIGGLASHGNGLAIVGGAVVGGLAGNAIARHNDCHAYRYYHHGRYYNHRRYYDGYYHYW
ncbi:MAG TPA: hypothetical protein VMU08_14220 [Rhizomicrobium sp.]|nr:hypothetical protein [Rhizomicrobium sp.]